jgi:transcriptional regulator with XRE-family HTH domain
VTWRKDLGEQIRKSRKSAGMTQLDLAQKAGVKREHISNIELGKNSPAVKIVTDIARALGTKFHLEGCAIDPFSEAPDLHRVVPLADQMSFDFDIEYHFDTHSVRLTARSETELELRAVLFGKRRA